MDITQIIDFNSAQAGLTMACTWIEVWVIVILLRAFGTNWNQIEPIKQNEITQTIKIIAGVISGIVIALAGHTYTIGSPDFINYLHAIFSETVSTLLGVWGAGVGHDFLKQEVWKIACKKIMKMVNKPLTPTPPDNK